MSALYYSQTVLARWTSYPVAHATEERARFAAAHASHEASHALVWDCSESPSGRLVAKYVRGVDVGTADC